MAFVPEAALIALREGLEALLITGILLGLVSRLGRPDARRYIWLGLASATVASLAMGLLIQAYFLASFEDGGGALLFEFVAALVAVAMLTYMVFWMWKHTRGLMASMRKKVVAALTAGSLLTIAGLTFASVLREGLEVVMFYAALAPRYVAVDLAWSGALGFAVSAGLVWLLLRGSARIDLQKFFALTGVLLIFIAGGLIVHSVHAAHDLGWVPHGEHIWDTSAVLPNDSAVGRILHAFVGYEAAPTLLQAVAYFGYVFGVGGWYVANFGLFKSERASGHSNPRFVAGAAAVLVVASLLGAGASGVFQSEKPLHTTSDANSLRVGVLYRSHGEPPEYNETTYASFARFGREVLEMFGYGHLLLIDQGTVLLDRAHPYAPLPALDAELMDAWTARYTGPAVFVADPGELTGQDALRLLGPHYLAPGTGPGLGEPDILELWGLRTFLEWQKMAGWSPHYGTERPIKDKAVAFLEEKYGAQLVVRHAYMVNPHMHPRGEIEEAAQDLVASGVDVVVDVYASSIHSDVMNTCMMARHAHRALEEAGFKGPVVAAGMAGLTESYAAGVAEHVATQLARFPAGSDVAVFLSQHGLSPERGNPCGDGLDQYARNAEEQFRLAKAAIERSVAWSGRLGLYHTFAQGADEEGDPNRKVLSPLEALDRAKKDGFSFVLDVPYEFAGNGFDNLIVLREAYGFTRDEAPYYDPLYESHFTRDGVHVTIASAAFSTEAKARAQAEVIGAAIEEALAGIAAMDGGGHEQTRVTGRDSLGQPESAEGAERGFGDGSRGSGPQPALLVPRLRPR